MTEAERYRECLAALERATGNHVMRLEWDISDPKRPRDAGLRVSLLRESVPVNRATVARLVARFSRLTRGMRWLGWTATSYKTYQAQLSLGLRARTPGSALPGHLQDLPGPAVSGTTSIVS